MAQAATVDRAAAAAAARTAAGGAEAEAGCALTCECWDCRSYRRHLLRLTAVVLLACGLGGGAGWQRGVWRSAGPARPAEVGLAAAAAAEEVWY